MHPSPKLALAGATAVALSAAFIFQRTPAPLVLPTEQSIMAKNARTIVLAQMPFETPSWVPDEATKIKALKRAYQLNGNSMVGDHMIDVSKEDLTEHVTADQPAHAAVEIVAPNERNALDAQAEDPDWDARRRFMNRTFRNIVAPEQRGVDRNRETRTRLAPSRAETKPKDVCAKHDMHKVVYRGSWRCRK